MIPYALLTTWSVSMLWSIVLLINISLIENISVCLVFEVKKFYSAFGNAKFPQNWYSLILMNYNVECTKAWSYSVFLTTQDSFSGIRIQNYAYIFAWGFRDKFFSQSLPRIISKPDHYEISQHWWVQAPLPKSLIWHLWFPPSQYSFLKVF